MKIVEIAVMIDAVAANPGRIIDNLVKEETVEKIDNLGTINLQKTVNLTSLRKVKTINPEENREVREITINHPNLDLKTPSIQKTSQVGQGNHIPGLLPKLPLKLLDLKDFSVKFLVLNSQTPSELRQFFGITFSSARPC